MFFELSKQVDQFVRAYVDKRFSQVDEDRINAAIDAGRALIMLGCSFLGNAIGLKDPDIGLQPGRACLQEFERLMAQQN